MMGGVLEGACTVCGLPAPVEPAKQWTICVPCYSKQSDDRRQYYDKAHELWRASNLPDRTLAVGILLAITVLPFVFPLFNEGVTWRLQLIIFGLCALMFVLFAGLRMRQHRRLVASFRGAAAALRCVVFVPNRLWGYPQVVGYRNDLPISMRYYVIGTGKRTRRFLEIGVFVPFADGRIEIRQATEWAPIQSVLGLPDLDLDDAAFDEAFRVLSDQPAAARVFLSARRRDILVELDRHHERFIVAVNGHGVRFTQPSASNAEDPGRLRAAVDALCDFTRSEPADAAARA